MLFTQTRYIYYVYVPINTGFKLRKWFWVENCLPPWHNRKGPNCLNQKTLDFFSFQRIHLISSFQLRARSAMNIIPIYTAVFDQGNSPHLRQQLCNCLESGKSA